jgi:hypothetical protein
MTTELFFNLTVGSNLLFRPIPMTPNYFYTVKKKNCNLSRLYPRKLILYLSHKKNKNKNKNVEPCVKPKKKKRKKKEKKKEKLCQLMMPE